MRKNVLDYDRINDKQRELIYKERRKLLNGESVSNEVKYSLNKCVELIVNMYVDKKNIDYDGIIKEYNKITLHKTDKSIIVGKNKKEVINALKKNIMDLYEAEYFDNPTSREQHERSSMLLSIDSSWMEQLRALDFLRQDIGYVGYAQIDPKSQYAVKAFDLYSKMKDNIYVMTTYAYFNYNPLKQQKMEYEIGKAGA